MSREKRDALLARKQAVSEPGGGEPGGEEPGGEEPGGETSPALQSVAIVATFLSCTQPTLSTNILP